MRTQMYRFKITVNEWLILQVLNKHSMNGAGIERALQVIERTNVYNILTRLEEAGYIETVDKYRYRITENGKKVIKFINDVCPDEGDLLEQKLRASLSLYHQ